MDAHWSKNEKKKPGGWWRQKVSAGWSAAACSYRKVGARCSRASSRTFLSPPPFWLKMTQRFMQRIENLCMLLPCPNTKLCLNLSSKRDFPSKLRFGVLKLVERLVSALRHVCVCFLLFLSVLASWISLLSHVSPDLIAVFWEQQNTRHEERTHK